MYNLSMLDYILENGDQREIEKFVKSEKIVPGSDGWLSSRGNYYQAKPAEHGEAAEWIIGNNLSEVTRNKHETNDLECFKRSKLLNARQFLLEKGWILINGRVFHTDNALNFTTMQLRLLTEAGIPVVGAYDGSKEFSSRETLEWIENSSKRIYDFIDKQKIETLKMGERRPANQTEFWIDIRDRGYSTLDDFKKDPFNTTFGDFGVVSFADVRDVLTEGFRDEIVFDQGQETYTLRLIKLVSGERICVEYTFHHHVGHGWGNEEHMNAYVVDNFTFKEKIKKYFKSGINSKIHGEYFKDLIREK